MAQKYYTDNVYLQAENTNLNHRIFTQDLKIAEYKKIVATDSSYINLSAIEAKSLKDQLRVSERHRQINKILIYIVGAVGTFGTGYFLFH